MAQKLETSVYLNERPSKFGTPGSVYWSGSMKIAEAKKLIAEAEAQGHDSISINPESLTPKVNTKNSKYIRMFMSSFKSKVRTA